MLTPTAPPQSTMQSNFNGMAPAMATADERMQKFAQIAGRHEISHDFASRLRQLEGYEIVFICDDSGSMATAVGELNSFHSPYTDNQYTHLKNKDHFTSFA
jgi:hypothetical protein